MVVRVQIVPIEGFRLFSALVRKEIDLGRREKGTFYRSGPKVRNRSKWSHKSYKGWINFQRSVAGVVTAEIRSRRQNGAEWQLLHAFIGFVARHFSNRIEAIHIQFPRVK